MIRPPSLRQTGSMADGYGSDADLSLTTPDPSVNKPGRRLLLGGVFLVSFSLIAFEIALSRLLSVLLSYHYVFAVLAIALLGLGGGGIFLHLFRGKRGGEKKSAGDFSCWAAIFALTVSLSVILGLGIGASFRALDHIFFYGPLFLVPFFFVGILLAHVYREFPADSAEIYGFDLVGAACGSFGCLLLLDLLGVVSTVFLLGFISAAAALLLAGMQPPGKKKWIIPGFGFVMLALVFGAERGGFYQPGVPIGKNTAKEIHDVLYGPSIRGEIVETRWSAFGRTDLVKLLDYPEQMDIYLDGTAGSPMYRFTGDAGNPGPVIEGLKTTFPGYFPFLSLHEGQKNNALIIGPGGGRDVLLALMGGVKNITAVEVNQDLVDMVRRHSLFNGGIYRDLKNVRVVVEEGRHFLKRHKGNYDLIMLSLPVTNTSRSLEGFALTENFLFTTDAIADYWDHLSEEGRLLVVAHDDIEALRLLSLSLAVFKAKGVDEMQAMRHIYMTGSEDYLVFVLTKKPLEHRETAFLYQAMRPLGYNPGISFFPGVRAPLNPALAALERGEKTAAELRTLVKGKGYDIDPVSDNNPFFYKFEKGLPTSVSLVLWVSAMLLLLVAGAPLLMQRNHPRSPPGNWPSRRGPLVRVVLLFIVLGVGFMLIEISLMQRFSLFLGSPVLSMAVLLSSLLAGAGMGGLWSKRLMTSAQTTRGIARASLWVAAIVLGYAVVLPLFLDQLLGLSFALRVGIAASLLLPLGFCMGIPFPSGIRLLQAIHMESLIPWMWGVNGLGSVLGSTLTIAVAIRFGFTEAMISGAALYLVVFVLFRNPASAGLPAE
jgi:hypothetical protein